MLLISFYMSEIIILPLEAWKTSTRDQFCIQLLTSFIDSTLLIKNRINQEHAAQIFLIIPHRISAF